WRIGLLRSAMRKVDCWGLRSGFDRRYSAGSGIKGCAGSNVTGPGPFDGGMKLLPYAIQPTSLDGDMLGVGTSCGELCVDGVITARAATMVQVCPRELRRWLPTVRSPILYRAGARARYVPCR